MRLSSTAFEENAAIPASYTCDGANVNPPLSISGVPSGAKSLVLILDDPDIPQAAKDALHAEAFDHWVVFNIPPETTELLQNMKPGGTEGDNTAGTLGYTGPCPPDREHRYFFKLYALDAKLTLPSGALRQDVEQAMDGHVIESAELVARYQRPQSAVQ
ncbi:YbhB/YbcL family Raf kinase inhibitor-like protein [Candidatus Kaiserbacteria bacterium]|nr:YbhB/YbcL family Raf kinase inhibitor-like protein [Candidatus Kaiserbacteria bacterium]